MRETVAAQVPLSQEEKSDSPLKPLEAVSERQGLEDIARRLGELQSWLANELSDLETHLKRIAEGPKTDIAWHAAHYLLQQPGKRVRPICVVLTSRMGGRLYDHAVRDVAMACELVHNATLLHDDVLDQGAERRGVETARMIFGNSASVLGGDHLLIEALRRVQSADSSLTSSLIEVIDEMVNAEAIQLEARGTFSPSRARYLNIVLGKTAALFRWALTAGAHIGGLTPAQIRTVGEIGENLGMTFQLVDDLLDLETNSDETGKSSLRDLNEGKLTWPLIIASERSEMVKQMLVEQAESAEELSPDVCAKLVAAIRDTGAVEETMAEATRYANRAIQGVQSLPKGESRRALETVVQTALRRRK